MSGTVWQENALRFATRPEQAIDAIANHACREAVTLFRAGEPGRARYVLQRGGALHSPHCRRGQGVMIDVDPTTPNNTDGRPAVGGSCWCGGAKELVAVMAETGMGQWDASRFLWPVEPLIPIPARASHLSHSEQVSFSAGIHTKFHAWFPWLRGCCEARPRAVAPSV